MIVCVCRGVSEREIGEAIAGGAESVACVVSRCGAGGDCGACRDDIRSLLDAHARPPVDRAA